MTNVTPHCGGGQLLLRVVKMWSSPGNKGQNRRLRTLAALFITCVYIPVVIKLPQRKQMRRPQVGALMSLSVSWKQEVTMGERAQSEGRGIPRAEHYGRAHRTQTRWLLHYNACGTTVIQFYPFPCLTEKLLSSELKCYSFKHTVFQSHSVYMAWQLVLRHLCFSAIYKRESLLI